MSKPNILEIASTELSKLCNSLACDCTLHRIEGRRLIKKTGSAPIRKCPFTGKCNPTPNMWLSVLIEREARKEVENERNQHNSTRSN